MSEPRKADPIKRARTRQHNATVGIDWESGETMDGCGDEVDRGHWWDRFDDLADGVLAGKGVYDTFYPIGSFDSPHGAQQVIRQYKDKLPDDVVLTKRTFKRADGTRGSVLYGALLSEALPEVDDVPEVVVRTNGGITWTEPQLPLTNGTEGP